MQDNDNKLIWEQYNSPGREYGPSGSPSINVMEWKVDEWYTLDELEDWTNDNPYTKHVDLALTDLEERTEHETDLRKYVAFFGPPQGSTDYENWTDPCVVVALASDRDQPAGGETYSMGIFTDNDGAGESHTISDQQVEQMIQSNNRSIEDHLNQDREHISSWDPYGRNGVVDRSDFY